MSIELLNSTESSSSPIDADELKVILKEESQDLNDTKDTARRIAHRLSIKSSKHKFLVSVTKIDSTSKIDADLSIQSVIGTVWDDQKDGYWSFRVDDASTNLITVYWIHVD